MRFVHFSDTHLGFSDLNKIDATTGINQRESDFYRAWWQAIDKILELKPDFVVHAGDLFQTPRPNNRAIRVGLEGIQRLNDADIPFVVVAGNHSTLVFDKLAAFLNRLPCFQKCMPPIRASTSVSVLANAHCIVCRTVRLAMSYRPPIKP